MEQDSVCVELPDKMASLNIEIEQGKDIHSAKGGRCLRTRVPPAERRSNRRVLMKPQKRPQSKLTEEQIRKLYSNQSLDKHTSRTLETIFEEPKVINDTPIFIGLKKLKRALPFPTTPVHSKEKIKKRRSKIKRLLSNKNSRNKKKISMEVFMNYLKQIDSDNEQDAHANEGKCA